MQCAFEETIDPPGQLGAEWYAAYIKHHHEKKAAYLLEQKGVEVFLPQHRVIHRWKDRNKALCLPLFPGYLFLHSDLQNKFQILNTPGLFFLVESAGNACPIPRQEIDSLRQIVQGGVRVKPHPFVSTGDSVRICSGPLSGVQGILARFKTQYRVVLTIGLLQRAVSIEVEADNVERIVDFKKAHGSPTGDLRRNFSEDFASRPGLRRN